MALLITAQSLHQMNQHLCLQALSDKTQSAAESAVDQHFCRDRNFSISVEAQPSTTLYSLKCTQFERDFNEINLQVQLYNSALLSCAIKIRQKSSIIKRNMCQKEETKNVCQHEWHPRYVLFISSESSVCSTSSQTHILKVSALTTRPLPRPFLEISLLYLEWPTKWPTLFRNNFTI